MMEKVILFAYHIFRSKLPLGDRGVRDLSGLIIISACEYAPLFYGAGNVAFPSHGAA